MRTSFLSVLALLLCVGVGVGVAQAANNNVLVCHVTGSDQNPMHILSVNSNSVMAHLAHGDTLWSSLTGCSGDVTPE